jgi:hypothetical protein
LVAGPAQGAGDGQGSSVWRVLRMHFPATPLPLYTHTLFKTICL